MNSQLSNPFLFRTAGTDTDRNPSPILLKNSRAMNIEQPGLEPALQSLPL
jgi:hypothetical protein